LAADPQNSLVKQYFASESANLGLQLGVLGQKKESERLLDRAIAMRQFVSRANPQNRSMQATLAAVLAARGDNSLHWKNFKAGLDDYRAAIDIYRQLLAANPKNTVVGIRLPICRLAVAHTRLRMGDLKAAAELQSALADLEPILTGGGKVRDDALYAAAAGYADLGKIEVTAARHSVAADKKSHWESAAHWYGLSLSTLKRVQDLAGQSESEAFGPLDPAVISKQLSVCESALSHAPHPAMRAQ